MGFIADLYFSFTASRSFNKLFCRVCLGIANHLLLFAYYELFYVRKKANGKILKLDMCTVLQKF